MPVVLRYFEKSVDWPSGKNFRPTFHSGKCRRLASTIRGHGQEIGRLHDRVDLADFRLQTAHLRTNGFRVLRQLLDPFFELVARAVDALDAVQAAAQLEMVLAH